MVRSISSSKSDGSTTAAAPAAASRRERVDVAGQRTGRRDERAVEVEAEVLGREIRHASSSVGNSSVASGRLERGHAALDPGELAVEAPPLVDVRLREREELGRVRGVRAGQHRESALGRDELRERDRRVLAVELERVRVLVAARAVPVQRPVAGATASFWCVIDVLMSMPWAMHVE